MSIPSDPRQQMINIMYLVLIAMLALSVSAEIVKAFQQLDAGLRKSSANSQQEIVKLKASLQMAAEKDEKVKDYLSFLPEIEAARADFIAWVENLQDELKLSANGEPLQAGVYWPDQLEDQASSTKIMTKNGKARELVGKIKSAREKFLAVFEPKMNEEDSLFTTVDYHSYLNSISLLEPEEDWESTFDQMPLVGAITLLDKIKSDCFSSELTAINQLQRIATNDRPIYTDFSVAVLPSSRKIIQGDPFQAEVFLTTSSKMSQPEIKINGRTYQPDEMGRAIYENNNLTVGTHQINAEIAYRDGYGKMQRQNRKIEFEVVTPPSHAPMIGATKMNVLYIGLDNPVAASILGIRNDATRVSLDGVGNIAPDTSPGNYVVRVSEPGEVKVVVQGRNEQGEELRYDLPFRVKRIPDPLPIVGKCSGCSMRTGEFKAQDRLRVSLKDFYFKAKFEVEGFEVSTEKDGDLKIVTNRGGAFSEQTKSLVNKAQPGDIYYFDRIRAKDLTEKTRRLPSIAFRIM